MPFSWLSSHTLAMYPAKAFTYDRPAAPIKPSRRSRYVRRPLPALGELPLQSLRIDQIREALRINAVSFPSQVPAFERDYRPDLQLKLAQLYFVFGWSCGRIAARYGIVRQRASQIISTWTRRAVDGGYIQFIPPAENIPVMIPAAHAPAAPFRISPPPIPVRELQTPSIR